MSVNEFGLQVQQLPKNDQVLIFADLAGRRHISGWFNHDEITNLFEAFHIPEPDSIRRSLGQLCSLDLVRRRNSEPCLGITPLGYARIKRLSVTLSNSDGLGQGYEQLGADFAHERHSVIPPYMAPLQWRRGISRFLDEFEFEKNVFLMTRFPSNSGKAATDVLHDVIEQTRHCVSDHGLVLHLASDRQIEDDLWGNVGAHMWACQYGIGFLEPHPNQPNVLNSNVQIEIGSMLITGRRCAILHDRKGPKPPSDLSGHIYKSVDFADAASITEEVHKWLANDLGLGKCQQCP